MTRAKDSTVVHHTKDAGTPPHAPYVALRVFLKFRAHPRDRWQTYILEGDLTRPLNATTHQASPWAWPHRGGIRLNRFGIRPNPALGAELASTFFQRGVTR